MKPNLQAVAMTMWKNAVDHVWQDRSIEEVRKLIDRQSKVMLAIIEAKGGQSTY